MVYKKVWAKRRSSGVTSHAPGSAKNFEGIVATLALGLQPRQKGYKVAGQKEAREPRQRGRKGVGQKEAREPRQRGRKGAGQEEARESHHILPKM
jgi:hypothetical protein